MTQDNIKRSLLAYFSFLLLCCFVLSPYRDTFYYWEWSRHLALSYYDGPPLIAYAIRAFTSVFGTSLFALNLVGLLSVALSSFFIYKITELLADKKTAWLAAALWFTAPFVNQELLARVTYDNLLNLFWVSSLYYLVRYIRFQKSLDCYKFACSAGLMLLSKYTGLVLLMAVLVFFISQPKLRGIFKTKQFYLAIIIILLMLSPIFIWNIQHDWLSIKYQMNIHQMGVIGYANNVIVHQPAAINFGQHIINALHYLKSLVLNFNILLIIAIVGLAKSRMTRPLALDCLIGIAVVFIVFWTLASALANVAANYTMPLFSLITIIAAYYLAQFKRGYLVKLIIGIFLLIDVIASISHIEGLSINTRELNYNLAKQANMLYLKNPQPIITPHYVAAEQIGFWLSGRPQIYALSCGLGANQYEFWQQDFMAKLTQHQVKQALFLDYMNEPYCIQPYFKQCTELPTITMQKQAPFNHRVSEAKLYVYRCSN
ncbi:MAG: glycosyltransferase family 39 protein [Gammaproteobacteria bacterium]|nr:glycosyltransferase family 39 protein [Gammaproteobacteria bacterium]